jgi:hypothetical protein
MSCGVHWSCSIFISFVDVGTKLLPQAAHYVHMALLSGDAQWSGTIIASFVDVCVKLVSQAQHYVHMALLSCGV